ncbi:MAG: ABC transporter ATP-binding protein [Chitinophagaceae bacterium]
MRINCVNAGKRFNREWIFRNFSFDFLPGLKYAITGPNGSGKSTLLQVLAGAIASSEGSITYNTGPSEIDPDKAYQHLSLAAPYLDLVEEMSVGELLAFHSVFKPFMPGVKIDSIISEVDLSSAGSKQIRFFSSGMKQRVKLAQAIFSDTRMLFLDEPTTNLDDKGIEMYSSLITRYCQNRTLIVSSNDPQEYGFCDNVIRITDYK